MDADGGDFEAAVAERHHPDDSGDRADGGAHVAATDLTAPFDEHDSELRDVRRQAIEHEPAVPRLEDVQRQQFAGQHDVAEREHRHAHRPILYPGPSSAAVGPDGYDARTSANASQIGR